MINPEIIQSVKEKSISEYLRAKNVKQDTKRSTSKNSFFYSPFTNERTASLVVNESKNTFFDNSYQIGGDVIKICMELEKCDFKTALEKLSGLNLTQTKPQEQEHNILIVDKVHELRNLHLEDYLTLERKINVSICYKYLCEVHFHYSNNPKKKLYAVGFKNDLGGYEIRNAFTKVMKVPKTITTINPGCKSVSVFEGFMDFLSAVTYWQKQPTNTIIVLNGTSMISHADLTPYEKIYFYGDNGKGGNKTLAQMPSYTKDCRSIFKGYGDFNEFLVKTSI